jgi:hypothetical protein
MPAGKTTPFRAWMKGGTVITTDTTVGTTGSNARGDRIRPAITAALVAEPGIHGL